MEKYIYKGREFQFDEKDVPASAVPVEKARGAALKEKPVSNKAKEAKGNKSK